MTPLATLHAVADGEPCRHSDLQRNQFVLWDGHVCVPSHVTFSLVRITDNMAYDVLEHWERGGLFQPVRLERWSDQK